MTLFQYEICIHIKILYFSHSLLDLCGFGKKLGTLNIFVYETPVVAQWI